MFTDWHDYVYHVTIAMRMRDPFRSFIYFSPACLVVLKTKTVLSLPWRIQIEFHQQTAWFC